MESISIKPRINCVKSMTFTALAREKGTWKWGILCLLFLAPFFFLSYGFANQYAAGLVEVSSIVFEWEKYIPLWPWTIVPYWSIDLFYGFSLLLCWNKFELKQHALRLFAAQIISISCFIIFPLKFSFERLELYGFFGLWFDVLMGFDKPFNQMPSLHIVLLVILWDFYRRHTHGVLKYAVDLWSFLIGISILTTWQHHFIDLPTGLIVGSLCLWLFPLTVQSPFKKDHLQVLTAKHLKLGSYYLFASLLFFFIAYLFKGLSLWLLYPALSLFLVCLAYFLVRPHFFQKTQTGQMTTAAWILFLPYIAFAFLNSRIWTKKHPEDSLILEIHNHQMYLGRLPNAQHAEQYALLFDCCAELPLSKSSLQNQISVKHYATYLSLDLIPLQANQLQLAVEQLDQLYQQFGILGTQQLNLLIYCALGYSRSSAVLAAWLIKNQYCHNANESLLLIQKARPWVVLKQDQIKNINLYALKLKGLAP